MPLKSILIFKKFSNEFMDNEKIEIKWPNGKLTIANAGDEWLIAALNADVSIPTGCLTGSCGACEIEVNGEVIRACINKVPKIKKLTVDFSYDPFW